jgi:hypothetical protein
MIGYAMYAVSRKSQVGLSRLQHGRRTGGIRLGSTHRRESHAAGSSTVSQGWTLVGRLCIRKLGFRRHSYTAAQMSERQLGGIAWRGVVSYSTEGWTVFRLRVVGRTRLLCLANPARHFKRGVIQTAKVRAAAVELPSLFYAQ